MHKLLLLLLFMSFGIANIYAQNFDEVEVLLLKNKYFLFNAETREKISKLGSVKKMNGLKGNDIWQLNAYIVSVSELKKKEELVTIYNSNGVLSQQFSYVWLFELGTAFEKSQNGSKYSMLEHIPYFTGMPIGSENTFGVYTLSGETLIPPRFYNIEIYHRDDHNRYYFTLQEKDKGYGLYLEGKEIIAPQYTQILDMELNTFIPVRDYIHYGMCNLEGDLIIPVYADEIIVNNDTTFTLTVDDEQGLLDKTGDVLIPFAYDEIEKVKDGKYLVKIDKKQGIFDIDSQKIIAYVEMEKEDNETEESYTYVDQMPEFPGGQESLMQYIAKNTNYPPLARDNDIEGKVFIEFIVDKRGKVKGVKVAKGVDTILDNEALRVVRSLPRFKPGEQDGKKVNVKYILPINFKLG